MKKLIYLFCLYTTLTAAQKPKGELFQFNFKAEYIPAKVTFNDGHVENGFIYGFIENRKFEINVSLNLNFQSLENDLNLDDKVYDFKNTMDGTKRKLTINDINEVILTEEGGKFIIWRLFDLKTANAKGEVVDGNRKIWLPLIKKDVVNIYGYDVYSAKEEGSNYLFTLVYLHHKDSNYAIPPIDFSKISLMNVGKLDEKYIIALKDVFKDCPEFVNKLDTMELTKEEKKNARAEYMEDRKKLKALQKGKSKQEAEDIQRDYFHEKMLKSYVDLIEEYKTTCK